MRSLITGGNGFAAQHLARHLISHGDEVAVTTRATDTKCTTSNGATAALDATPVFHLDLNNKASIHHTLKEYQPTHLYHLAAMTFVPEAEKNPTAALTTNAIGTCELLNGIRDIVPQCRVLHVSSSEIYGDGSAQDLPFTETSELRPANAYAISKVAADLLARDYALTSKVDVVIARPFPHLGPGQSSRFALSSFAKQLAEIKQNSSRPELFVGNLDATRDYCDVADIVIGYHSALNNGITGEAYNFCSGNSYRISDLLTRLIDLTGEKVKVTTDPERLRAVKVSNTYGSYKKARDELGWMPKIKIDESLRLLYEHWCNQVADA